MLHTSKLARGFVAASAALTMCLDLYVVHVTCCAVQCTIVQRRAVAPCDSHVTQIRNTVNSLCDGCFGYHEICSYIELSLLRGTTAVRMQWLVTNNVVLTSTLPYIECPYNESFLYDKCSSLPAGQPEAGGSVDMDGGGACAGQHFLCGMCSQHLTQFWNSLWQKSAGKNLIWGISTQHLSHTSYMWWTLSEHTVNAVWAYGTVVWNVNLNECAAWARCQAYLVSQSNLFLKVA